MGFGDEVLGSGIAKGTAKFKRRVAFGDGKRIHWHNNAVEIFRGNPNVAPPGSEKDKDLIWVPHWSGNRAYAKRNGTQWIFNPEFKAKVGEIFLNLAERGWAETNKADVIIEPNVKGRAANKQWPVDRYQAVADALVSDGLDVAQVNTGPHKLEGVRLISAPTFRFACAAIEQARLYIGPEGGLHHAAAALGTKAVVIFGGFISPKVTGYDCHTNIFTGTGLGCGNTTPCTHCTKCMDEIGSTEVIEAARMILGKT